MARRAPAASAARQRAAFEHLQASAAAVTEIQIELAEIPAPSGAEEQRAAAVAHWLRSAGCRVDRDSAGNVIALRAGGSGGRRIALSSHLDTVFPADQAVRVTRGGGACRYCRADPVPAEELHGPGIADDAAGLAALIALAQALAAAEAESAGDLLFIATVGEEGRGNLRGARHLFQEQSAGALDAFVTIDHPDPEAVVHRGIGSRRFAVHFYGPGGHAWGDFGRYNPAYALAATAQRLASMALPSEERCTLNVGVMEAGRSVNAIPEHARMEVDLRSEAAAALGTLEAALRAAVAEGQAEELTRRPSDRAWVGDRTDRRAPAWGDRAGAPARAGGHRRPGSGGLSADADGIVHGRQRGDGRDGTRDRAGVGRAQRQPAQRAGALLAEGPGADPRRAPAAGARTQRRAPRRLVSRFQKRGA